MQILRSDNDIMKAIKKSEARNDAIVELLECVDCIDTVNSELDVECLQEAKRQVLEAHPHLKERME